MIKVVLFILIFGSSQLLGINLVWPTEDDSFFKGELIESLIQPTASGITRSGLFGYTRNNGKQFHEGIDIKPKKRDRKGEALDKIRAVMDGQVVYINSIAGNSSYGKYIVILHNDFKPEIYTLYAHLSSINSSIKIGKKVQLGEIIGIMGRSSAKSTIPKGRAHLHFEMGVMISENFKKWYDVQKFGNPNKHSIWNGYNLTGFDPLDFYTQYRDGKITNFDEYFKQLPPAFTLQVLNRKIPNFVSRYPSLVTKPVDTQCLKGWNIDFTWYAMPFRWTPIYEKTMKNSGLIAYNPNIFQQNNCQDTIIIKAGKPPQYGKNLEKTLSLLFEY